MIFIRIFITDDAKKFLKNRKDLIIELKGWSNWNCTTELKPSVSIGIPKNLNAFDFFKLDDFSVYVSRKIFVDDFIKIFLAKFYDLEYLAAIIN